MTWHEDWQTVQQTPQYQGASDEQKEAMRLSFFETVIAPNYSNQDQPKVAEAFDRLTSPYGDPNSGAFGDFLHGVGAGFTGAVADTAQGLTLGHSNPVSDYFRTVQQGQLESLSPSMLQDIANTGFTYDKENGIGLKEGSTWQGAVGLGAQGFGSIGAFLLGGGPAAKGFSKVGQAIGGTTKATSAAVKARNASQANQVFNRQKLLDKGSAAAGYGSVGGFMGLGGTSNQVYEEVMALSPEQKLQSQRYRELLQQYQGNEVQATKAFAKEASLEGRGKAFALSAGTTAIAGPIETSLLKGTAGATRGGNIIRGMVTEMGQEAAESGGQRMLANIALDEAGIATDPMQGVIGDALTGATIGGVLGGGLGAIGRPNKPVSKETLSQQLEAARAETAKIEQQLQAPDLEQETRDRLEVELGNAYRREYQIKQAIKTAPTLEQIGQAAKGEVPEEPGVISEPRETPERRDYVPTDIEERINTTHSERRHVESDYRRIMQNGGTADTVSTYEQKLNAIDQQLNLYEILKNNRSNQQYFETEADFTRWISKLLEGGQKAVEAAVELNARKMGKSAEEALKNRARTNERIRQQQGEQDRQRLDALDNVRREAQFRKAESQRKFQQRSARYPKTKSLKSVAGGIQSPVMDEARAYAKARIPVKEANTTLNIPLRIARGDLKQIGQNEQGETLYQDVQGQRVVQPSKREFLAEPENAKRSRRFTTVDEQQSARPSIGRYSIKKGKEKGTFVVTGTSPAESARFGKKGYGGVFDADQQGWVFANRQRKSIVRALNQWSQTPAPESKGRRRTPVVAEGKRTFSEIRGNYIAGSTALKNRRQKEEQEARRKQEEQQIVGELAREEAARLRPSVVRYLEKGKKQKQEKASEPETEKPAPREDMSKKPEKVDTSQERVKKTGKSIHKGESEPVTQTPQAEPEPEAEPEPTINKGFVTRVAVPKSKLKLNVQYKVVENADLVVSHNLEGRINPDYPADLQPRDRSREGSKDQIIKLAGRWDPDLAVANPLSSDGAVIVNADNQVESGNGRTLALRYIYDTKKTQAEDYQQYLIEHAAEYGLDPDQIRRMERPQLVRERLTPLTGEQLQEYLELSNDPDVAKMSASEQAFIDAKKLDKDLMLYFNPAANGDLDTVGNQPFLNRFYEKIKGGSTNLRTDNNKNYTLEFFSRVQGAIFAKAYGDKALVQLALEEKTKNMANILKGLNVASVEFARVKAKHGDLQDLDLLAPLIDGIKVYRDARATGQAVDEYVLQIDFEVGSAIPHLTAMFAKFIDQNVKRHRQMGEAFRELAQMIDKELDLRSEGNSLFGEHTRQSLDDILKASTRNIRAENEQLNLEQTPQEPPPQAPGEVPGGTVPPGGVEDQQGAPGGGSTGVAAEGITATADQQAVNPDRVENEDVKENNRVPGTPSRVERDRQGPDTEVTEESETLSDESKRQGQGTGRGGSATGVNRDRQNRGGGVSESDTSAAGEPGDQPLYPETRENGPEGSPAGSPDRGRSGDADATGLSPGRPENPSAEIPDQSPVLSSEDRQKAQQAAEAIPVVVGDLVNVRETLPILFPEQQEDVAFVEKRLWQSNERGAMLTNGTGTGKTFSGMGTIKRYVKEGKTNILILTPSQEMNQNWADTGALLGVSVTKLPNVKTAGQGVVVATYANLGDNNSLIHRDWDLIVADESHNLKESNDFEASKRLSRFRALTGHPGGHHTRAEMTHPEQYAQIKALEAEIEALEKSSLSDRDRRQQEAELREQLIPLHQAWRKQVAKAGDVSEKIWTDKATRSLMLSATPFAHRKTVDYAEGYLFDYPGNSIQQGYYTLDGQDQFFINTFGYRFRYGKLTEPDVDVDTGLMERNFNNQLKASGAMRSRMLEVEKDYDRRFELVEGGIGAELDAGIQWIDAQHKAAMDANDKERAIMWRAVNDTIHKRFDYHSRAYLLESIKAKAAIDYIREHLALGRKVVVFHDYNTGGGFHPFRFDEAMRRAAREARVNPEEVEAGFQLLAKRRPDLLRLPLDNLESPRETFRKAFGDELVLYSGKEDKQSKKQDLRAFNDDNGSKKVILVNSAAGNSGISLHDTTGQFQRVLINLGIPVRPTYAIQIEGRIYRVKLQSNALFRYMSTGLPMEQHLVATKLAARAGTAENLAMGDDARALKQAFIQAYLDADVYPPGMEGEGLGGKAIDRLNSDPVSPFEKAKTYYFARQKRTRQTRSREGQDYFPTPDPYGFKMSEWLHIEPGDSNLEPSGGDGAVAQFMSHDLASLTVVEPSYELAGKLAMNAPNARLLQTRFEELDLKNKYHGIAMNPPYGVGGKMAMEHLAKAYKHLKDGGRLIAIIPQGPAMDKRLNKWLESKEAEGAHITADIKLPAGIFDRAGTGVATRTLIIDRNNDPDAVLPATQKVTIQSTNIKDFFNEIEHLDFERDRSLVTKPEANASTIENPVQYLDEQGLVVSQDGDTLEFTGDKTYELKAILKLHGAQWDKGDKAWRVFSENADQTLANVAADIQTYMNSPFKSAQIAVIQEGGVYKVLGNGTRKHKEAIRQAGGRWSRSESAWVMDSDPTEVLATELDLDVRYRLAEPDLASKKNYQTKALYRQLSSRLGQMANVVHHESDLPKHLYERIKADGVQGRVKGVYDPRSDSVYVIAANAQSVADGIRTALHEAVGHKGLRKVLGPALQTTLEQIYHSLAESEIRVLRKRYANQLAGQSRQQQRLIVAGEYLAHLAEHEPQNNWLQKTVATIRQWLRKTFPGLKWNDAEVRQLIIEASQASQGDNTTMAIQDTPDAVRYKLASLDHWDKEQVRKTAGRSAQSLREMVRNKALGALGGRQITQLYQKIFDRLIERDEHGNIIKGNPLKKIGDFTQQLSAMRSLWANRADQHDQQLARLASKDKISYRNLGNIMHESTIAEVDPSQPYQPKYQEKVLQMDLKSALLAGDNKTAETISEQLAEEKQRQEDYRYLKGQFDNGLSSDAQQLYQDVRDYYKDQFDATRDALVERVEGMNLDLNTTKAVVEELKAKFASQAIRGPYFPLMRFGDFAAIGETPEGKPFRAQFESLKALNDGIEDLERRGYIIESRGKTRELTPGQTGGVQAFSKKIMEALEAGKIKTGQGKDARKIDNETKMAFMDEVNQIALAMLPELSAAKRGMHRKKIAGYDENARRAFATVALHGANRLGRIQYGWRIDQELERMDQAVDAGQFSRLEDQGEEKIIAHNVTREMRRRHELNMNPNGHPLASHITNLAFIWYLGGSVAAGLINMSQNLLIALPQLGSQYGFNKTRRAMMKATKDYFAYGGRKPKDIDDFLQNSWFSLEFAKANKHLTKDELAMIKRLIDDGTIDTTQAHTLAQIAGTDLRPEAQRTRDWYTKMTRGAGLFFHNAEVANRQIAALTAYRLYKEAKGKDFDPEAAIDYTRHAVFEAHFDYSSFNRPRYMKGNWAKVFLIFKQYSQNISFFLGNSFYNGVLSRQQRGTEKGAQARRALLGTLGLHALFAGALGLPGMSVMLWAAGLAMGDEDDPVDPEAELRNVFSDWFGPTHGRALSKGVFNGYLSLDLSSRLGLNDLWVRAPGYDMPVRQEAMYFVTNALGGPAVSQMVNTWVGLDEMASGDTLKGFQRIVPKFIRDGLKTLDYSRHGVVDSKGVPLVEDPTLVEKAGQTLGFGSARVSEAFDARNVLSRNRNAIARRRSQLLNQLDRAIRQGNKEEEQRIRASIDRFNEVQKARGRDSDVIKPSSIRKSLAYRQKRREESDSGIFLPEPQLGLRELVRFLEP